MLINRLNQDYQKRAPSFPELWFWILCGIIILHTALLHLVGLHSPATPVIQLLRPLVTSGAVALLILSSQLEHGVQRWSRLCLAFGMACSALFSFLKITRGAAIAMPEMRILWVFINFGYIFGTALYLRQYLLRPGSALLVFHGSITVGIATLIILHSILPQLMLWPWNTQVTAQLPSLSFDIGSLFVFTFLRMRFGKNLSFFLLMAYHACLILAEALLTVIVWADWPALQGVGAPTYPLYALQSVLFAFAIYRDSRSQRPEVAGNERILWEEAFIWVGVPGLVISAFFTAGISRNVPPWLLTALYISGILYVILGLNDHWRIMQNIYLVSLARLKATLNTRQPPED